MSAVGILGVICAAVVWWGWAAGNRRDDANGWRATARRRPGWPEASVELAEKIPLRFPLDLLPVFAEGTIVASASRSSGYRMIGLQIATDLAPTARAFYLEVLGKNGPVSTGWDEGSKNPSWTASQTADGWFVAATVHERPGDVASFVLLKATPESLRSAGPVRRLVLRVRSAWLWANGQPD